MVSPSKLISPAGMPMILIVLLWTTAFAQGGPNKSTPTRGTSGRKLLIIDAHTHTQTSTALQSGLAESR
jgi:hypothetical protein